MEKYFNIYENIDKIDLAKLKEAAGINSSYEVTWPKGKKWKVMLSGKECTVTTSFANAAGKANGNLDAFSALSTMMTREEVVERIRREDPDGGSDAVYFAQAEFLPGLPKLTDEERKCRIEFTAAVLTLLSNQKTIEMIAETAPKKKNGLLHKGRITKIGLTGFAESYGNNLVEIIGKAKDETNMLISITERSTSPEELEEWNHDFISTYHEGLPISEAFNIVLADIPDIPDTPVASKSRRVQTIKPDLFDGLGTGEQKIDTSDLDKNEDYSTGVKPKYQKEVQELLGEISKYLIDPNKIEWDGKGVFIDRMSANVFRDKMREVGAVPQRAFNKRTNYSIRNIDYRTYRKRCDWGNEEYYINELKYRLEEAQALDGMIEERDFIRWCLNGHAIKYDISKDEHLKDYENDKVTFKKIDTQKFIKQAIKKTTPGDINSPQALDDSHIYYCVVGLGDNAEKVRSFFKSIGKAVMDKYVEGARWPRLILGDPNGEDEKRAYKIYLYNKENGESVYVWSADQVLDLINQYGDGIKEHAEKYFDNTKQEMAVKQILESTR